MGGGAGGAGRVVGSGAGGRGFVEVIGGSGGEAAGALACQRLLVEAGAFERFGYSDMAVTCARSVLQVRWSACGRGGGGGGGLGGYA